MQSLRETGPARPDSREPTPKLGPSWWLVLPPLLAVLAVPVALRHFNEPAKDDIPRDADLCPLDGDAIGGSAAYLVDFSKPLDKAQASLPGDLLRNLSLRLGHNAELQVLALTNSEHAPRVPLGRLCKPYANADLQTGQAMGSDDAMRGCDGLPALLPASLRQSAIQFCERREELQRRLEALAGKDWGEEATVTDAYLVKALEDTQLEFTERPEPHTLYLFSDMVQHAHWYSHLEPQWADWSYEAFAELPQTRNQLLAEQRGGATLHVEAFYVPRNGLTDQPRARRRHQQFWLDYFSDAQVAFHNLPPMRAYRANPLINIQGETEMPPSGRTIAERELQLNQEQEALDPDQRTVEAPRQPDEPQAGAALQTGEPEIAASPQPEPPLERTAAAVREEATAGRRAIAESPSQPVALPPCAAFPASEAGHPKPPYPQGGRVDFGEAQITVRYVVNELGETVDDEVVFLKESSSWTRSRYLRLFTREAIRTVQDRTYVFPEGNDGSCSRYQTRTASFRFQFD